MHWGLVQQYRNVNKSNNSDNIKANKENIDMYSANNDGNVDNNCKVTNHRINKISDGTFAKTAIIITITMISILAKILLIINVMIIMIMKHTNHQHMQPDMLDINGLKCLNSNIIEVLYHLSISIVQHGSVKSPHYNFVWLIVTCMFCTEYR